MIPWDYATESFSIVINSVVSGVFRNESKRNHNPRTSSPEYSAQDFRRAKEFKNED